MTDMKDEDSAKIELVLEAPPEAREAVEGMSLFPDDTLAYSAAKLGAVETMLGLLVRNLTFKDFTRELLLCVLRVIKCEAASILELEQETGQLFFRAVVGRSSDRITHFQIPLGKGIAGHVAESKLPLRVDNAAEHSLHLREIATAVGFEARSLICVPLLVRCQVYGVIQLLNRAGQDRFSDSDLEVLNYLADMASKTLEARLMLSWALASAESGKAAA